MRNLTIILLCLLISSCNNREEKSAPEAEGKAISEKRDVTTDSLSQSYSSQKWHFSLNYPGSYKIFEGQLPGEVPVVNVYLPQEGQEPPLAVHEEAASSYIAFLPKGFGVDGPSGERKILQEWEGNLPLSFAVDQQNSFVYLLKNGDPRGFSLRFYSPPPGWSEHGSIQVFYSIKNFESKCFRNNSEAIPLEECDPLMGDRIVHSGELDTESRENLNSILESLYFIDPQKERQEISELIQVEQPKPEEEVSSPLKISGKARGYWFFEGTAPFEITTRGGKIIAEGNLEAKESWMTEEFVPFEANTSFEIPNEKRGYLKLSRANASGKPEHDRVLRIPIIFN